MTDYIFCGVVYPTAVEFSLERPLVLDVRSEGREIHFRISLVRNRFVVTVKADSHDLWALKNTVIAVVRTLVDAKGFLDAIGWDVLLESVTKPDGGMVLFHGGIPELHKIRHERLISPKEVLELALRFPNLRRALESLREAVRVPLDRAFHCFRALECIRLHYYDKVDGDDRAPSWRRMSEALYVRESWVADIREWAKKQRHGETLDLRGPQSVAALKRTYAVVDRFCVSLLRGIPALPKDEFEYLQLSE